MYFDFTQDEEYGDDEIYNGVLPRTEIFEGTRCDRCKKNEAEWGVPKNFDLLSKRQFNKVKKEFYEKLIKSKMLSGLAEMLSRIYPKPFNNYHMLEFLLKDDDSEDAREIKRLVKDIQDVDQQIEDKKMSIINRVREKMFIKDIIKMKAEKRRLAKEELHKTIVTESVINLRKHLCDPKCVFCQTHCNDSQYEHTLKGKLCDCKCLIFDTSCP